MQLVLGGIAFVHKQSVVHTDLGPAAVLVQCTDSGKPLNAVVVGFGKATSDMATKCTAAAFVATQQHLAPELWTGCKPFSYATDIWALGCKFAQ